MLLFCLFICLQTRILVTHGISFLPQVDNILVMVDGRVSEMGSYQELLNQNGTFAEFLRNYSLDDIPEEDEATGKASSLFSTYLFISPYSIPLDFYEKKAELHNVNMQLLQRT